MNRNKIISIIFVSLIFCFLFLNQESYAKGKFVKLNFIQENDEQPVKLNENEIFYAGGFTSKSRLENIKKYSAKIYNIKTKKLQDLNIYMNVPRAIYGIVKYDSNNILILGGYCAHTVSEKQCDGRVAENYNISKNKFERLDNLPLCYTTAQRNEIIKLDKKVFIVAQNGIMEFDIQAKKFKKLLEFDKPFVLAGYNAYLLDSNNILIWGGHYKNIYRAQYDEEYYANMLKYDISKNKLTEIVLVDEPNWKNPISPGGIPLDNGRIMFLNGNQDGGTIYIYDNSEGRIENYGNTKFGIKGSSGIYLGNNKVLLVNGMIDSGMEPFIRPSYLEYEILD